MSELEIMGYQHVVADFLRGFNHLDQDKTTTQWRKIDSPLDWDLRNWDFTSAISVLPFEVGSFSYRFMGEIYTYAVTSFRDNHIDYVKFIESIFGSTEQLSNLIGSGELEILPGVHNHPESADIDDPRSLLYPSVADIFFKFRNPGLDYITCKYGTTSYGVPQVNVQTLFQEVDNLHGGNLLDSLKNLGLGTNHADLISAISYYPYYSEIVCSRVGLSVKGYHVFPLDDQLRAEQGVRKMLTAMILGLPISLSGSPLEPIKLDQILAIDDSPWIKMIRDMQDQVDLGYRFDIDVSTLDQDLNAPDLLTYALKRNYDTSILPQIINVGDKCYQFSDNLIQDLFSTPIPAAQRVDGNCRILNEELGHLLQIAHYNSGSYYVTFNGKNYYVSGQSISDFIQGSTK